MHLPDIFSGLRNSVASACSRSPVIPFGLAALVVFLLLQLVVIPVRAYQKNLTADLAQAQSDLATLRTLAARYAAIKATGSVAVRAASGDKQAFYAFVEGLTRKLGLTRNMESIRPDRRELDNGQVEEEVVVRFRGLLQPQLIDFLYAAEIQEEGVEVKQIGMRKDKERLLDVDITLVLAHAGQ